MGRAQRRKAGNFDKYAPRWFPGGTVIKDGVKYVVDLKGAWRRVDRMAPGDFKKLLDLAAKRLERIEAAKAAKAEKDAVKKVAKATGAKD